MSEVDRFSHLDDPRPRPDTSRPEIPILEAVRERAEASDLVEEALLNQSPDDEPVPSFE